MNLLFCAIAKIIHVVMVFIDNKFQPNSKIFASILKFLREGVTVWGFVVGVIESSAMKIGWCFMLQMQLPSHFSFFDKVNCGCALLFFFVYLCYGLCFYSLVRQSIGMKKAALLLIKCKAD